MQFSDVIGHESLKTQLVSSIKEGRIAHAQMFMGHEGTGALPLALAYATLVNCENPLEHDSCGVCNSCNKMNKLIHGDLHFTYPSVSPIKLSNELINEWREAILNNAYIGYRDWILKIGTENKQGNITADETNDIIRRLSLKALEGKFKIQIIWGIEYLGKEGNKLLKIFEEPPEGTLFLMICEDPNQVLPTILSRVQTVRVPPIDNHNIAQALMRFSGFDEIKSKQIASLSNGSWLLANALAHNTESDLLNTLKEFLNLSITDKNISGRLKIIEQLAQWGREPLKLFLGYLLDMLQKSEHVKFQTHLAEAAGGDENKFLEKLASLLTPYKTEMLYQRTNESIGFIERNANAKLVLFNLSLSIRNILN